MSAPLRIGLVTPGWPGHDTPNGIATAVYHMAAGLREAGHRPVILAIAEDGYAPDGIPVVKIARRPWTLTHKLANRLGVKGVNQRVFGESLADAMDAAHALYGLDVVIVEDTFGWACEMIRRGTAPVVVFLHGPWLLHQAVQSEGVRSEDALRNRREDAAFRAAAGLISPVAHVLKKIEMESDVAHVPRIVIPNAYASAIPATDFPPDGPILFVGRFDRHKGGDTVLDSFARLHDRHPTARLTFAGPDRGVRRPDGQITSMAEAIGALPEAVQVAITAPGRQSSDQVAKLRQSHPIAMIASRYEVFGYTMIEAMAAGQAIVASRVGGPAEVLEDEITALLVPPDDPDAMADALYRLTLDPALCQNLGAAARAKFEAEFNRRAIAERTVAFLRELL